MFFYFEKILKETEFQGYPIITASNNPNLIGYVNRSDLLKGIRNFDLLEKGKKKYHFSDDTFVYFDEPTLKNVQPASSTTELVPEEALYLSHVVDQTPLGVDPSVSMEFVLDMFKKLGIRLIVVKRLGKLLGILTKKDLLRILESPISISQHAPDLFIPVSAPDESDVPISTTTHRFKTLTFDEEMELLR